MDIKWIRGKPIFIILLFAVLILFLSVVIVVAGQQGKYLKTSSTDGIDPDGFLYDCLIMSRETLTQCLANSESIADTCIKSYPYSDDPFEPNPTLQPISKKDWEDACLDARDIDLNSCEEARETEDAECNRLANGLRGSPPPDPTPLDNPTEQSEEAAPQPTP